MSVSYWGIVGYGVCIDNLYKYLDHEKINKIVRKLNLHYTFDDDVLEDDTFEGAVYDCFAEFLCDLDDDNIFNWDDDGNGRSFFLYMPSYPWQRKENEPQTLNQVRDRMVKLLKIVCDASSEDLYNTLGYISDWGCG